MSATEGTQRLRFDPVLNWGHVLVAFTIIVSAIGLFFSNELRAADHEYRIKTLELLMAEGRAVQGKVTDQLNTILVEIGSMKVRLPPPQSFRASPPQP